MKPKQQSKLGWWQTTAPHLWGVAVCLCIASLWGQNSLSINWVHASIFLALALISELKPVHLAREGILLSLSMPFIIGLLVMSGPLAFVCADVAIYIIATYLRRPTNKRTQVKRKWLTLNIPICMVSASVASLNYGFVTRVVDNPRSWVIATILAVCSYEIVNGLAVSYVNSKARNRRFTTEILMGYRGIILGIGLLGLVALANVALIEEQKLLLIPVLLVPILMLRSVAQKVKEIDDTGYETMVTLTLMLQRAHPYSHGHLGRVGIIAEEVGLRLGISRLNSRLLREAAVLHDIGKIAIDEQVLDKPAKLTDEEYEHVKQHAEYGAQILVGSKRFQEIIPWIRFHHERPDGRGYPSQLIDIEIPLESKVISVADAFDAMVGDEDEDSQRSYRVPKTIDEGLAELERCSNTQFDPEVVAAFKEVILSAR